MPERIDPRGKILKQELDKLGVTPTAFARQIDVPPNRISQIIAGKRGITANTALRFGCHLPIKASLRRRAAQPRLG